MKFLKMKYFFHFLGILFLAIPSVKAETVTSGKIRFVSTSYQVKENEGKIRIAVERFDKNETDLKVNYFATPVSAVEGLDYSLAPGQLVWGPGETGQKYFEVSIIDDAEFENEENFTIALSTVSDNTFIEGPSSIPITILPDGDLPLLRVQVQYVDQGPIVDAYGGGRYEPGTVVEIRANSPLQDRTFDHWEGGVVADSTSITTTLIMPAGNVNLLGKFRNILNPVFSLGVFNGVGGGYFFPGKKVFITANPPLSGKIFDHWEGFEVESSTSISTSLIMPGKAITVRAIYRNRICDNPKIISPINNSTFVAGDVLHFEADQECEDYLWVVGLCRGPGCTNDVSSHDRSFNYTVPTGTSNLTEIDASVWVKGTPSEHVILKGVQSNIHYETNPNGLKLESPYVPKTTGSIYSFSSPADLSYLVNSDVEIIAPPLQTLNGQSYRFVSWSDGGASSHTIHVAPQSSTYTAVYEPVYYLYVYHGGGTGYYRVGDVVTIHGEPLLVDANQVFDRWTGYPVADPRAFTTTFVMPAKAVNIVDTYKFKGTPTLLSLSQSSAPFEGGTWVDLFGYDFQDGAKVSFGVETTTSVFVSESHLKVLTPYYLYPSPVGVEVINPNGLKSTLANSFYFHFIPKIEKISVSSGPTSGGTEMTITGSNFHFPLVYFGNKTAESTFISTKKLIVKTPIGPNGKVDVTVVNHDRFSDSIVGGFTYVETPPALPQTPYSFWILHWFNPAEQKSPGISGAEADPDQDSISNLREYAFNLNPKVSDKEPSMSPQIVDGYMQFTFPRIKSATDILYIPEGRESLFSGKWSTSTLVYVKSVDRGDFIDETYRLNYSTSQNPTGFMRVRVVEKKSPSVTLTGPINNSVFKAGDWIEYSGVVTNEDGELVFPSLRVQYVPDGVPPSEYEDIPFEQNFVYGSTTITFTVRFQVYDGIHGYRPKQKPSLINSSYVFSVNATNSFGLAYMAQRVLQPYPSATVKITSVPEFLTTVSPEIFSLDGRSLSTATEGLYSLVVPGMYKQLAASMYVTIGDKNYKFFGWEDSSSATRTIHVVDGINNYKAVYRQSYYLEVTSGTGSGFYAPGEIVHISLDSSINKSDFTGWVGYPVDSSTSTETTLIMPSSATYVAATTSYMKPTRVSLLVVRGTGSGFYYPGSLVSVSANDYIGYKFDHWSGTNILYSTGTSALILVPNSNVGMSAEYLSTPISTPIVHIDLPVLNTKYRSSQVIEFSGTAVVPENIYIDPTLYFWTVTRLNGPNSIVKVLYSTFGVTSGSFTIPNDPDWFWPTVHDYFYRVSLMVRSPGNNSLYRATQYVDIYPLTSKVTATSFPVNGRAIIDGLAMLNPYEAYYVVGSTHTLSAPEFIEKNGKMYKFSSWSDGGAMTHQIKILDSNMFYLATYTELPIIIPAPIISSISPNEGPTAGNLIVSIYGAHFSTSTIVKIGGVQTTDFLFVDENHITTAIPALTAGSKDVVVINPDGQVGSLPNGFTYKHLYYILEVRRGTGGGYYYDGEIATIRANDAPIGKQFDHWTVKNATAANNYAIETTILMPTRYVLAEAIYVDTPTQVNPQNPIASFNSSQNQFNPKQLEYLLINYALTEKSDVAIRVFDSKNILVNTLREAIQFAGNYNFAWDGRDSAGNKISAGDYSVVIFAKGFQKNIKVSVIDTTLSPEVDVPVSQSSFGQFINVYNPDSGDLIIPYSLLNDASVSFHLYDVLGDEVQSFSGDGSAGTHQIKWNGRNNKGDIVSSDVYILVMKTGNHITKQKIIVQR